MSNVVVPLCILNEVDSFLAFKLGYKLVTEVLRLNRKNPNMKVYYTKVRLSYNNLKISAS